jgi:hypothetical protein
MFTRPARHVDRYGALAEHLGTDTHILARDDAHLHLRREGPYQLRRSPNMHQQQLTQRNGSRRGSSR